MNSTNKKTIALILIPLFYIVFIVSAYVYVLFIKTPSPPKKLYLEIEDILFENYIVRNGKASRICDESVSYNEYAIKLSFKCNSKDYITKYETQQLSIFQSANAAVDPPRPTFEEVLNDSIVNISLFDINGFDKGISSDSNIINFFTTCTLYDEVIGNQLDYKPNWTAERSVQNYFEDYCNRNFILFRFGNNIKPMGMSHKFVIVIQLKSGKTIKGTTPEVKFHNV